MSERETTVWQVKNLISGLKSGAIRRSVSTDVNFQVGVAIWNRLYWGVAERTYETDRVVKEEFVILTVDRASAAALVNSVSESINEQCADRVVIAVSCGCRVADLERAMRRAFYGVPREESECEKKTSAGDRGAKAVGRGGGSLGAH